MAIPITCAGCQAAFDVPENLLGKTIRCTECREQMVVEAPAGKKGFGWASKSDVEPSPEELPEDAPVAKSKPTSRKAANDDDDEDAKPAKKSAPVKKAGGAGSALAAASSGNAKKRRPADDDDDDDDDDRPQRKKKGKQAAASGPPVALLVGAVVALAAIAGVGIWMLTGKKDDAAKNDNKPADNKPADNPQPNVPPATNPIPNVPANWQKVTTGGLACEMPGNARQKNDQRPGGMTRASIVQAPDDSYGFFVFSLPLPPGGSGTPAQELNEAVEDAGKPGELNTVLGIEKSVSVVLVSTTDVQQDGFPGKELQVAGKAGDTLGGVMRLVLVGKRVYVFGARAKNYAPFKPHAQRFLTSVKITKGSDDTPVVSNDPPKKDPGPVVDPPKKDPPPVQPAGPITEGKLAAKLNAPFFAGAFDSEKKELVVVGVRRVGNRQGGTLQRYSLPDFKPLGSVNIPSVATRAALDPQKGLLYVTTLAPLTNVAVLEQSQYDRPVYSGDVAVYDLAQLRDGKFDEKTEFKPAGIISVGKIIRDITLSNDGKSIFVLTASTAKGATSQVIRIDTGDRKTSKAANLTGLGWDMVCSADGQKLFVTGVATGAIAPPMTVIETATMTLLPSLPLAKSAFSVAVSKDGRIATSSLALGGAGGVGGVVIGGPPQPPIGGIGGPGGAPALEIAVMDSDGRKVEAFRGGVSGVSNNGYLAFSPDGKYLLCSSHHPQLLGTGFDVYETSDKFAGEKAVATLKKAGQAPGEAHLGGAFLVSPDSDFIVFNNGAVLKLGDLGSAGAGGGGLVPPGGGLVPPGGIVQPGLPGMGLPMPAPGPGVIVPPKGR